MLKTTLLLFVAGIIPLLARATCELEAFQGSVPGGYALSHWRFYRFDPVSSVKLIQPDNASMKALSNRRLSGLIYQSFQPVVRQTNLLSNRPERGVELKESQEGSYQYSLYRQSNGEVWLQFEEKYSLDAMDSAGGHFGIGPIHFKIEAPVHFSEGSLEDFTAGKAVAFELTPEGSLSAARQVALALARWTQGEASKNDLAEARLAVEDVHESAIAELADDFGWDEAEMQADFAEIQASMFAMIPAMNHLRLAQQEVRVEKVPEKVCLHFRGSSKKMSIVFSPAQEYIVSVYFSDSGPFLGTP